MNAVDLELFLSAHCFLPPGLLAGTISDKF
jgi:hypothetical protein